MDPGNKQPDTEALQTGQTTSNQAAAAQGGEQIGNSRNQIQEKSNQQISENEAESPADLNAKSIPNVQNASQAELKEKSSNPNSQENLKQEKSQAALSDNKESGAQKSAKQMNTISESQFQNISAVSRYENDENNNQDNEGMSMKSQQEFSDSALREEHYDNQDGEQNASQHSYDDMEKLKKEIATLKAIVKEKDSHITTLQNEIDRLKKGNSKPNVIAQNIASNKEKAFTYSDESKSPILQPYKAPIYESFWNQPDQSEIINLYQRQPNKKSSLDQILGANSLWVLQSERTDQPKRADYNPQQYSQPYLSSQQQQQQSQPNYQSQQINYSTPSNQYQKNLYSQQPLDLTLSQEYPEFGAINMNKQYSQQTNMNNNSNNYNSNNNGNMFYSPQIKSQKAAAQQSYQYADFSSHQNIQNANGNKQNQNSNVYQLKYYKNSSTESTPTVKSINKQMPNYNNQFEQNKNTKLQNSNSQKTHQIKTNSLSQPAYNQKHLSGNQINNTKLAPIQNQKRNQ